VASVPLRSTAVVAAPKDYSVPAGQEIYVLSVHASYTDNGAAGDWLPAVVIQDNNGNALCRAVDQGVKVTAGSSAEVSFFPGVKHAAAGVTPAAKVAAYATGELNTGLGDPAQTVPANTSAAVGFPNVFTTDSSVLSWTTGANTNDTVTIKKAGLWLAVGKTQWSLANFHRYGIINGAADQFIPGTRGPASDFNPSSVDVGQQGYTVDIGAGDFHSGDTFAQLSAGNLDGGSSHNVTHAWLNVYYWPTS
jgi:hypothetical protein